MIFIICKNFLFMTKYLINSWTTDKSECTKLRLMEFTWVTNVALPKSLHYKVIAN